MSFAELSDIRKTQVARMINILSGLSVPDRWIASAFDLKPEHIRQLRKSSGISNKEETPGFQKDQSRQEDVVVKSIQKYLGDFEVRVVADELLDGLHEEFRRVLDWLLENIKVRVRVSPVLRVDRSAVIRHLRLMHGLTAEEIAWITGYVSCTVGVIINGSTSIESKRSTLEVSKFLSVLLEYAELTQKVDEGDPVAEGIEDVRWYLGVLEKYLKVPELLAFLLGVEEERRRLKKIGRTPEQEPYVRLFLAVADRHESNQEAPTKIVAKLWKNYLSRIHSGQENVLPESAMNLRSELVSQLEGFRNEDVWPVWTNEMSRLLDVVVGKLTDRQQEVVRLYYGFGVQKPLTLNVIGKLRDLSRERINQVRREAHYRIRSSPEFKMLRRQMATFGEMETCRVKNELEIARLNERLVLAEEENYRLVRMMANGCQDPSILNQNLFKKVDILDMSVRSANCLQNAGIEFIYQLVEKTETEMLKIKNFGPKCLNEIKELLAELSLSLGTRLPLDFSEILRKRKT